MALTITQCVLGSQAISDDDYGHNPNPNPNEDSKEDTTTNTDGQGDFTRKEDGENTKPEEDGESLTDLGFEDVTLQNDNINFEQGESSSMNTDGSGFVDSRLLSNLIEVMTCSSSYPVFVGLLAKLDTYEAAEREGRLTTLRTLLTITDSYFLDLALNQNGTRCLQTLLRRSPNLDRLIFRRVYLNFMALMNSDHGRCLIVPMIRAVDTPTKEFLFELTYNNSLSLATEVNGCIALIDVIQEIKDSGFKRLIFNLIAHNAYRLCFDLCGTQVVQNLLSLQDPSATQAIVNNLCGSYFKLAMGRQGSYVVEKCLRSVFGREIVLAEFRENDEEWVRMANDEFGSVVAQCALREMKERGMEEMLNEFVEKLRPHFENMKLGYGNNVLRVIEEIKESTEQLPVDILGFLP